MQLRQHTLDQIKKLPSLGSMFMEQRTIINAGVIIHAVEKILISKDHAVFVQYSTSGNAGMFYLNSEEFLSRIKEKRWIQLIPKEEENAPEHDN